jgi:hypothetical protein
MLFMTKKNIAQLNLKRGKKRKKKQNGQTFEYFTPEKPSFARELNLREDEERQKQPIELSAPEEFQVKRADFAEPQEQQSKKLDILDYSWAEQRRQWQTKQWMEGWGEISTTNYEQRPVEPLETVPYEQRAPSGIEISSFEGPTAEKFDIASHEGPEAEKIDLLEPLEHKTLEIGLNYQFPEVRETDLTEYEQQSKKFTYKEFLYSYKRDIEWEREEEFEEKPSLAERIFPEAQEIALDFPEFERTDIELDREERSKKIEINTERTYDYKPFELAERQEHPWKWESIAGEQIAGVNEPNQSAHIYTDNPTVFNEADRQHNLVYGVS